MKDRATGTIVFRGTYDGDGIRVKKEDKRDNSGTLQSHDYSYGPLGLLREQNSTTSMVTTYTSGLAQRQQGMTATDRFFHLDWLGSTRFLSDSSGNNFPQALRFDAYGNRPATQDLADYHATDLQFAGGWGYQTEWASSSDPRLGLQYLQQRYYDPAVGRFISPDPIGVAGGLNLYQYAQNDPVMMVDPEGETPLHLGALVVVGLWWLLASEAPAGEADPCYQHTPIVDQGPFQFLGPGGGAVRGAEALFRGGRAAVMYAGKTGGQRQVRSVVQTNVVNRNSRSSQEENHLYVIYDPRACYELGSSGAALTNIRQAKTRKCSPATVSGNRS